MKTIIIIISLVTYVNITISAQEDNEIIQQLTDMVFKISDLKKDTVILSNDTLISDYPKIILKSDSCFVLHNTPDTLIIMNRQTGELNKKILEQKMEGKWEFLENENKLRIDFSDNNKNDYWVKKQHDKILLIRVSDKNDSFTN